MPIPAPKSLDEVIQVLDACTTDQHKLGDIERHYIVSFLEEMRHIKPIQVLVCFGVLAAIDNDESSMRRYYEKALSFNNNSTYVNYNYGASLMLMGDSAGAVRAFQKCLNNGLEASPHLDKMAYAALQLGDFELSKKILILADKLEIQTDNIRFLAGELLLSATGSPQEEKEILEIMLPDEKLKQQSIPYSEEEWKAMQDFAKTLKEYI